MLWAFDPVKYWSAAPRDSGATRRRSACIWLVSRMLAFVSPRPSTRSTWTNRVKCSRTDGGAPVWTEVGLFGAKAPATRSDALARLSLPPGFAAALMPALVPGTSLYCALGSGGDGRTGPGFTVVSARPA